jgi:hypothetical protein
MADGDKIAVGCPLEQERGGRLDVSELLSRFVLRPGRGNVRIERSASGDLANSAQQAVLRLRPIA